MGVVQINGVAFLADLYSDAPTRNMVDMDVLVKEADYQRAAVILQELGYKKQLEGLKEEYWRQRQCHVEFRLEKCGRMLSCLDLHWALDFKRKDREVIPHLWDRLKTVNIDGINIETLSAEDAFFSLVLHQRRFGKVLNFKYAFDVASILKRYAKEFDWNYVISEAKHSKLVSAVFFLLFQAKHFLGIDISPPTWEKLTPPYFKMKLIEYFVDNNTFNISQEIRGKYLRAHFLLYDNFLEPLEYILRIPKEQFAKFYCLRPYSRKTSILYHSRLAYIPYKSITAIVAG
ncbi:MAG: nucleotidyltransferase family protein [Candidatus Omnitrophica bacterium]|nr:nucleotidyltransferase family protein [Candidatus Omnitrophota bacterium]